MGGSNELLLGNRAFCQGRHDRDWPHWLLARSYRLGGAWRLPTGRDGFDCNEFPFIVVGAAIPDTDRFSTAGTCDAGNESTLDFAGPAATGS